ncbi:MAG: outer membrane lipoprotein carrier protein LolA [Ignavibacteria bacterium]|jgi:outer membrane lipoprotein-sorting protein|nr:outer membrane lipoprotein carrier protein LolA [Ignavibacteria bacterium]
MKKIPIILMSFCLLSYIAAAQQTKESVYKQLVTKHSPITSISATFDAADGSINNCYLQAKVGNKYVINLDNRVIVSDGKTIWNYAPARKNVVISEYIPEIAGITLDKFFFEVIGNLTPVSLTKNANSYILSLINTDKTQEIKSVNLILNSKCNTINGVEITTAGNTQKWLLKNYKINKPIADKVFTFKTPDNTEVIDMRK